MHDHRGHHGPEKPKKLFTDYPAPQRDRYPVVLLRWLPGEQSRVCDQCGRHLSGELPVLSPCAGCGRWLCEACLGTQ